MNKKIFIIFAFILSCAASIDAQVTVGIGSDPRPGALLDIREKDASNLANSTRGLALPRVYLTSLTALSPMVANTNDAAAKLDHVGLTVYNMNSCLQKNGSDKGVYIWTGSEWKPILKSEMSANVNTFLDQDGNQFRAAKFGSAGVWMVDNLRAKKYDSKVASPPTFPSTPSLSNSTDPSWSYPAKAGEDGTNPDYLTAQSSLGLLYNWYAATAKKNTIINDQGQPFATSTPQSNEVEVLYETILGARDGKIQGICPNGWHLPSDREWNDLEREVYNNANLYSTYTSASSDFDGFPFSTPWNMAWEYGTDTGVSAFESTSIGFRPKGSNNAAHGYAMVSPCDPITSVDNSTGKSLSPNQGGFNVSLVGYVNTQTAPLGMRSVGRYGYIWASSRMPAPSTTNDNVLRRTWAGMPNEGGVYRKIYDPKAAYFTVRCKKDVNDFTINEPPFALLCGTGVANGAYVNGRALIKNENTITIKFNATAATAGSILFLSTNTVDGISFSGYATVQNGGGIQEATLEGNGTPNTVKDKQMTITATANGYSTICAVPVEMVRPALRVLFIGSDDVNFHYNFNPDEIADGALGKTWRLINTKTNFGNQNNSKVKTDGIIRYTTTNVTNPGLVDVQNMISANNIDMIVISYANVSANSFGTAIKTFLESGKSVIVFQEASPATTQTFLRDALGESNLIVRSAGVAGTIYKFNNQNHEILNGPFKDIKNLEWGEDASTTLRVNGFSAGSVTALSTDARYNGTGLGYTPDGAYTAFVHNKYNFIWVGDGGFNSDGNLLYTACPFAIDENYYPAAKANYGSNGASRTNVYNAYYTANVFAWAIKKVYEKKTAETQP